MATVRAPVLRTSAGVLTAPRRIVSSAPRQAFASVPRTTSRPAQLQSEFLSAFSGISSLCASLAGLVMGPVRRLTSTGPASKPFIVEASTKRSMGCTFHGSRRKKIGVSGFRARMATPGGRKVLQARRKRGRKDLCPAKKYTK